MTPYLKGFRPAIAIRTLPVSFNLEQLLQRSQVSDPSVTEALVQQYHVLVYRVALSILDDPDEAEDAAQETFIAAISNLDRYRGESSLKTWLYAITLNTCRGHLRKRKARNAIKRTWEALQSLTSRPLTPEESALRNETDAQLWAAVDALDEKHRLPIILRYVHNLSVPEIAQTLAISEGTAHSRLHYARKKLQGYLRHAELVSRGRETGP